LSFYIDLIVVVETVGLVVGLAGFFLPERHPRDEKEKFRKVNQ